MKIKYVHGDLMRCPENFIVHGCNAQGVMGSGVAKLLRDADEEVFSLYRLAYENNGNHLALGSLIFVVSEQIGKVVIDAITQEFYGRDPNTVYVSYDAIRDAMRAINDTAKLHPKDAVLPFPVDAVAMPLIGAGLANGKWSIISQIIEEEATHFQPVVYLIDGVIPDGVVADVETR